MSDRRSRVAADSSFDIVSKVDRQEVDNALNQAAKEVAQRYDFKGTGASIAWSGETILMKANTEERVKAVLDVFQTKLVKRERLAQGPRRRRAQALRQGVPDRGRPQGGHHPGERQEDLQDDPRRGPQGRQGPDQGRRAAGHQQEPRRPAGGASPCSRAPTSTSRCSSSTTADRATSPQVRDGSRPPRHIVAHQARSTAGPRGGGHVGRCPT